MKSLRAVPVEDTKANAGGWNLTEIIKTVYETEIVQWSILEKKMGRVSEGFESGSIWVHSPHLFSSVLQSATKDTEFFSKISAFN